MIRVRMESSDERSNGIYTKMFPSSVTYLMQLSQLPRFTQDRLNRAATQSAFGPREQNAVPLSVPAGMDKTKSVDLNACQRKGEYHENRIARASRCVLSAFYADLYRIRSDYPALARAGRGGAAPPPLRTILG